MARLNLTCRCGACELAIDGEAVAQLYCHCDDCQAAHSAAYIGAAIYPLPAAPLVRGEPVARVVRSAPRMHCGACGTYLFADLPEHGLRSVNAWLLPKGAFRPQFHVQCQHAVLPVIDALPHFKAFPAGFGGSDEQVGW